MLETEIMLAMKLTPNIIMLVVVIVLLAGFIVFTRNKRQIIGGGQPPATTMTLPEANSQVARPAESSPSPVVTPPPTPLAAPIEFAAPLDRATERVIKKKFGQYITPQNSPIQPERFTGYHTGIDFETFPDEQDKDVTVKAVCSGQLRLKESASGYGGVTVQDCQLNGQPITVIYGHLRLSSVTAATGSTISLGDPLGVLGKGYSPETDGERKHLHLGFHKGETVDIKGYVQTEAELTAWLDPCQTVCQ